MSRPFLAVTTVVAGVVAIVACSSSDPAPVTAPPVTTPDAAPPREPFEASFETFNIALAGAFVPNEAVRRPVLVSAIPAMTADVVCLQEAWLESDKDAIAQAAAATYPHIARVAHDLETPIDDATDQSGAVPPAATTAPCTDSSVVTLDRGLGCLSTNCSTIPNSLDGRTTSTACAEEKCSGSVASFLIGGAESKRCYGCLAPLLPTETFTAIRKECTENPKGGLAFGGRSGVMILSKHRLTDIEDRVLPGTWNRRVILRATAELPNGSSVDVYCNHLTPVFSGLTYPYTGQYGFGGTDAAGWEAEQNLQAGKLLAYVASREGNPAVVLGDFNTGPEIKDANINAEAPATYQLLASQLTPANAAGYAPKCTYCADNANNGGTSSVWIDHIFVRGVDASGILSTERTFVEASVNGTANGDAGVLVPLSDHYGMRTKLRIAPKP